MYLKKLRLRNIKCFEDVTLEFPHNDGDYSGWNVILGENATGKTALLQVAAYLLLESRKGPTNVGMWSRRETHGRFDGDFLYVPPEEDAVRELQTSGSHTYLNTNQTTSYAAHFTTKNQTGVSGRNGSHKQRKVLACGYGAHRRLTSEGYSETLAFADSRFLTLFYPHTGLAGPLDWLPNLYAASLDPKNPNRQRAATWSGQIKQLFNQLLPENVQIEDVTTGRVVFSSQNGNARGDHLILSEGYSGFLALAGNLLEHLWATESEIDSLIRVGEDNELQIHAEGIVLIDEADAHLHPSWQRELGERLCRVFPKIQFIVTTHSPFIAQEAREGGLFVLRPTDKGTVVVEQPIDSVRGWTASQILTSPLFGLESTRAPETETLIRESAALTAKEQNGKLTPSEKKRFAEVRKLLTNTLSAPGETYEEMKRQQDMADYVDQTLKRLKNGKS